MAPRKTVRKIRKTIREIRKTVREISETVREIRKTVRKILRQSELADAELALFHDGDLDALASNGFLTVRAFQNANPDLWEAVLPGRAALWGILRHQFGASLAEGDPPLKRSRITEAPSRCQSFVQSAAKHFKQWEQAEKEQAEKEQAEKGQAEKGQAEKEQAEKEQAEKEQAEKGLNKAGKDEELQIRKSCTWGYKHALDILGSVPKFWGVTFWPLTLIAWNPRNCASGF